MKVILTEKVLKLGNKNDVVEVNVGYARNFLFPRSLARQAHDAALAQIEFQHKREASRQEKLGKEAKGLAQQLKGTTLLFKKKASGKGQLFGSVTAKAVLSSLKNETTWVFAEDKLVDFAPLKEVGEYAVKLQLLPDLVAQFQVKIEAE